MKSHSWLSVALWLTTSIAGARPPGDAPFRDPSLCRPINWWNEALHGVAQGRATVFPQASGLAASWDTELMHRVADIISTEARAKYHDALTRPPPYRPNPSATLPGRTAGLNVLVAEHQNPGTAHGGR